MATMTYISSNCRCHCISLGPDIEKAREKYNKEVDKAITFFKIWYGKTMRVEKTKNKTEITWVNEWNEKVGETYIFDENNNDIYANL